jgi:hypothetical protein
MDLYVNNVIIKISMEVTDTSSRIMVISVVRKKEKKMSGL